MGKKLEKISQKEQQDTEESEENEIGKDGPERSVGRRVTHRDSTTTCGLQGVSPQSKGAHQGPSERDEREPRLGTTGQSFRTRGTKTRPYKPAEREKVTQRVRSQQLRRKPSTGWTASAPDLVSVRPSLCAPQSLRSLRHLQCWEAVPGTRWVLNKTVLNEREQYFQNSEENFFLPLTKPMWNISQVSG